MSEVVRGLLEMHFTDPEGQGGCGGQVMVCQVQTAASPLATSGHARFDGGGWWGVQSAP